jgi:ATP-dependent 26S proteasome regulatory subunit
MHILLEKPTKEERINLLNLFLKNVPLVKNQEEIIEELACLTTGYTPAELKDLVIEACMNAAREKITHVLSLRDVNSSRSLNAENEKEIGDCEVLRQHFRV